MSQAFIIKCVICKKDMEQKASNHKKCEECKYKKKLEGNRERRAKTRYPKECKNCGDKFMAYKINTEICSNRCRNKVNGLRRQIRGWETKVKLLMLKIEQNKEVLQEMYIGEMD